MSDETESKGLVPERIREIHDRALSEGREEAAGEARREIEELVNADIQRRSANNVSPFPLAKSDRAALRVIAGMEYVQSPEPKRIKDFMKDPRFAGVTKRTLERWSSRDKWVERRKAFIESWQESVQMMVASEIAQERIRDLRTAKKLQQQAERHLDNPLLIPKSYEGAVRTVLDILKIKEDLRTAIGEELLDKVTQMPDSSNKLPESGHPDIPDADVQEIARQVLAKRRGQPAIPAAVIDVNAQGTPDSKE